MTDLPILLLLHGVGSKVTKGWEETLAQSLGEIGYSGLDKVRVVAPNYPNTLRGSDDEEPIPKVRIKAPSGDAAKQNRRAFERRTGAVEVMLGRHDRGTGWFGGDTVVEMAIQRRRFEQAKNYVRNSQIRAQVLNRILRQLPEKGRLVSVGHSLGSVVATDLIRRLPSELEVAGLVTLGSPLANTRFHVEKLRETLDGPPTNLSWWVNFWNDADPVTTHRGVSSVFPWMIDHRIQTPLGLDVHDADTYLANGAVATAIGFALFGSQSKALVPVDRGVDIPVDYAETVGLLALRYAHLMGDLLDGEKRDRHDGALRQVQAATLDLVRARNAREGRPVPRLIAELAVDLSDPRSVAPRPATVNHLSKDDAIVPLISVAAANVLRPFEIDVPREKQAQALQNLTLEMGLGSQIGSDVFEAADRAKKVLKAGGTNWFKWVALGLGAAAVVAATGGMALLAAPGVGGAAAITSALAAFGPGGMIGGLLTAGTLVSAGGGGIAVGLASPATTAETVEAVVATQLTVALLRDMQGIEQDPTTWNSLVETGIEVRRERARIEAYSDSSAPTLKELKKKLESIDRALEQLTKAGLGPKDTTHTADDRE